MSLIFIKISSPFAQFFSFFPFQSLFTKSNVDLTMPAHWCVRFIHIRHFPQYTYSTLYSVNYQKVTTLCSRTGTIIKKKMNRTFMHSCNSYTRFGSLASGRGLISCTDRWQLQKSIIYSHSLSIGNRHTLYDWRTRAHNYRVLHKKWDKLCLRIMACYKEWTFTFWGSLTSCCHSVLMASTKNERMHLYRLLC